jgi:hypothetical protein
VAHRALLCLQCGKCSCHESRRSYRKLTGIMLRNCSFVTSEKDNTKSTCSCDNSRLHGSENSVFTCKVTSRREIRYSEIMCCQQ